MKNPEIKHPVRYIHHSEKINGNWTSPVALSALGEFSFNYSKIVVVDNAGNLFMLKEKSENSSLYYNIPKQNGWSESVAFDINHNVPIQSHFFIDDSEKTILFSALSNNKDLDILFTHYIEDQNTWSVPEPIIGATNSEFDEDSPFLSHD